MSVTSHTLGADAAGLRLMVVYRPLTGLALAANGLGPVANVTVANIGSDPTGELTVRLHLDFGGGRVTVADQPVASLDQAQSVTLDQPEWLGQLIPPLTGLAESCRATLALGTWRDAAPNLGGPTVSAAVDLTAANEIINSPETWATVAGFVQPNALAISTLLRAASELLLQRTNSGDLDGYLSGPKRAQQIAGAIYAAMTGAGVAYALPPASFELTGQKVRSPAQVLTHRLGTCIDLALTYAAAAEAAGLDAGLILTKTHAFPLI